MKRLLLVLAAIMSVAGYIVVNLTNGGAIYDSNNLIIPEDMPAFSFEGREAGIESYGYIKAYISEVIDGDTLEINYRDKEYKVRLLCIDTPELTKPGVEVQVYALEASKLTEKLVLHKYVHLVFEKGLRDKYGRLLAYVILENGNNLNAMLVRNGFARVELVSPNKKYKEYFLKLQSEALRDRTGMWSLEAPRQPFVKTKDGSYIPRYWETREAS